MAELLVGIHHQRQERGREKEKGRFARLSLSLVEIGSNTLQADSEQLRR